MPRTTRPPVIRLASGTILMALITGCARPSEGQAARTAPPVMRVEAVRPERHTVRRSVGEPGQIQAFETTALYANVQGYVKSWAVNIGAAVKKGQVLAELSVPELEAELRQKRAAVEQAAAKYKQAEAAVQLAAANDAGAETKRDRGPGRDHAGEGRPRPLAGPVHARRATVPRAGADRQPAR